MKNLLSKLLPASFLFAVALMFFAPAHAQAASPGGTDPGDAATVQYGVGVSDFTTGATESAGLSKTLMTVTRYALYVFYLLGVIFMGVAAIKFKNGDMEAMGKNLGGAVCLFLVPKIVEVILAWAAK